MPATLALVMISDAASGEPGLGIGTERVAELGQDRRARVNEDHANPVGTQTRIEVQCLADEVVQSGQCLDAGKSAAGHDERQQAVATHRALGVALFQCRDDAVPR